MTFDDFLAIVFSCLVSSGLAVFLMKKWIEHSFNARLARVEALNRIRAQEHQVRFTRYDGKVALAIEGAYELVCAYSEDVQSAVKAIYSLDEAGRDAALKKVEDTASEFANFLHRQAIYLPESILIKLRDTRNAMRDGYSAELDDFRRINVNKSTVYSGFLKGRYQTSQLQSSCDELLLELQGMLREHLSRFVHPE